MMRILTTFWMLFGMIFLASGQLTFQRTIGTPGNDRNYSLAKTADGGYITAGYTENFTGTLDIYVVKTDAYGNVEWSRTIGDGNNQRAWQIIADSRGGYVLVGATTRANQTDLAFMIRLNGPGTIDWQLFMEENEDIVFYGLKETATGNYITAGLRRSLPSESDMFVAKVMANGTLAFAHSYALDGNQQLFNIAEDANRHIVATGWHRSTATSGLDRILICKLDSFGNHLNTLGTAVVRNSNAIHTRGYKIIQSGGHYYVGGWSDRALFHKVDTAFRNASITNRFTNGQDVWNIPVAQNIFEIKESIDQHIMLAGYTQYANSSERDAFLMKISKNGQPFWARNYGGSRVDGHWPTEIVVERDRTFTLLSSTNTFGQNGSYDFYLVKTDFDGRSSCNTTNATPTVQSESIDFNFYSPQPFISGTVSSHRFSDTIRSSDVQKLCCSLRAISLSNLTVCKGMTLNLGSDSLEGYLYEWSSNGTVFSRRANPSFFIDDQFRSQTFKLRVFTNDVTCAPDSNTFTLTLNTRPSRSFVRNAAICEGDSFTMVAPAGSSAHIWRGPGSFLVQNINLISVKESGDYILNFRSGSCQYEDTLSLTVFPKPVISMKDTGFCSGSFVVITAPSGYAGYRWNNDPIATDSSRIFQNQGAVILTVIDANNCAGWDTFNISMHAVPPPFALRPPDSLCTNETVDVSGPFYPNHTYNWNNGLSSNRTISAEAGRHYRLSIINDKGCERSDSFTIRPLPSPHPLSDQWLSLCPGNEFGPDAEDVTYTWNGLSGGSKLTYDKGDSFVLVRTNAFGCVEKTLYVIEALPVPVFSLGSDTVICEQDSLLLSGPDFMSSYLWSTGVTRQTLMAKTPATYHLTVISRDGCSYADTMILSTKVCENDTHNRASAPISHRMKVFPNPSSGLVELHFSEDMKQDRAFIQVFNAEGKKVYSHLFTPQEQQHHLRISLDHLPAGYYLVQLNHAYSARIQLIK
jgi:methionine-rich copper-binding protein CopC